jgi:hypothetical protein
MGIFKSIKKIVKSVAPALLGAVLLPGVGAALGTSISTATGGAIGGAIAGGAKGGIGGAISGGIGGYGVGTLLGAPASIPAAGVQGPAYAGTGILGATTGGGFQALANTAASILPTSVASTPASMLMTANLLSGISGYQTAGDVAKIQSYYGQQALNNLNQTLSPYKTAGETTLTKLTSLVNDPQAQANYIMNNPFYQALAKDAEEKLLSRQATSGRLGTGGTAKALQESLLLLGKDLLSSDVSNMQHLANTGQTAATNIASGSTNLLTDIGASKAAGEVGKTNAINDALSQYLLSSSQLQGLKG